jgi:hypothetical protein
MGANEKNPGRLEGEGDFESGTLNLSVTPPTSHFVLQVDQTVMDFLTFTSCVSC